MSILELLSHILRTMPTGVLANNSTQALPLPTLVSQLSNVMPASVLTSALSSGGNPGVAGGQIEGGSVARNVLMAAIPWTSAVLSMTGSDTETRSVVPSNRYSVPSAQSVAEGVFTSTGEARSTDFDQDGGLRRMPALGGGTSQPQITVNINALDSRSLMDHSSEIADALRQALLDSHPLLQEMFSERTI